MLLLFIKHVGFIFLQFYAEFNRSIEQMFCRCVLLCILNGTSFTYFFYLVSVAICAESNWFMCLTHDYNYMFSLMSLGAHVDRSVSIGNGL